MKIFEITNPEHQHHHQHQEPQQVAPAPVRHKRTDGDHDIDNVYVSNPNFNPDDDNSSDELLVTVTFDIEGEDRPATWGYHGGEPAEHASASIMSVYGEDGVDIWDDLDSDSRDYIQELADEQVRDIINSSDDNYYEEAVSDIKKLSGLK